ncbi:MAG TPA: 50S ribosomal protein L13 [Candidatus Omnitrophota bacterium]|jgi:large subunit ribosomal protein L13|nr:50S ribosomal protein L13 [Candidatus Omnitrophota bacterium]HSA31348.1 50S ribosomal protein L13 [Candidatus Omnitrophota bacterium]
MKQDKTYIPKINEIEHKYFIVDAQDKILGRVATRVATILRGKHKPIFTPHLDTGDRVIIINAGKVRVTGNKTKQKTYTRYSGYPSGLRTVTFEEMIKKAPAKAMRLAVDRMLPKGKLGNTLRTRLKVYAGDSHPHTAQKPVPLDI